MGQEGWGDGRVSFAAIVGQSPAMQQVCEIARRVAVGDSTVLIQGESGTGKELFARAIHQASRRAGRPFVPLNCGAIPEGLLESELFGYDRGAFTGADPRGKPGKFELADGGTLFLDEVADLALPLQVKLLRALQEREIERLGGRGSIRVDVRVIAASNRPLDHLVEEGKFRRDLYYRLNVIPLHIPPLRERREDIPLLAHHFLARLAHTVPCCPRGFTPAAMRALVSYSWPGNVRELQNAVEFAANMCQGDLIGPEDLPPYVRGISPPAADGGRSLDLRTLEKRAILEALERYGTSLQGKKLAARALGISVATLYRKVERYSLEGSHMRHVR
ncbi:MAG: sigma 54-interacting transcriptional regulator [Bacillota bacterium]